MVVTWGTLSSSLDVCAECSDVDGELCCCGITCDRSDDDEVAIGGGMSWPKSDKGDTSPANAAGGPSTMHSVGGPSSLLL